jgi:solute:Na+ symporter, SSS family
LERVHCFLAVNCGALEVLGLSAMAAEFGVQGFQFYWIGAIPGIVFLALWMMPVYFKSDIRNIPDFLVFATVKASRS